VIISAATHRRVAQFFDCHPLGPQYYKGLAEPIEVFEVAGATSPRAAVAAPQALSKPILGRDREIELLIDRWDRIADGHGQSILLVGDAGIGKSRLITELRRRIAGEDVDILLCHCSAYDVASSLRPVIELIGSELGLGPEQSVDEKYERLETGLSAVGVVEPMALVALGNLLDLPSDPGSPFAQLAPQRQRLELFEASSVGSPGGQRGGSCCLWSRTCTGRTTRLWASSASS
jgi:hypothetical protein